MKDRIKAVRKETRLNQTDFGKSVGVSFSAEQKWELGLTVPSDAAIMNIVSKYGIREEWLRNGTGDMHESMRESELRRTVLESMSNRPEAFRDALVDTLMKIDPAGPGWAALVDMLREVLEKM